MSSLFVVPLTIYLGLKPGGWPLDLPNSASFYTEFPFSDRIDRINNLIH